MKDAIAAALILLALLFGVPFLGTAPQEEEEQQGESPLPQETVPLDEQVKLTVWDGEKVQEMTIITAIFQLSPSAKAEKPEAFHRSRRTWPKSTDMELPP